MQKLQCELCGSLDIIKQDGLFICQSCGCKYTLEEAKSLLSGTVTINRSSELDNLVEMIRNAFSDGEYERVIALCEKALVIDAEHLDCNLWYGMGTAAANAYDVNSVEVAASALGRQLSYAEAKLDDAHYLERAAMSMDVASSLVGNFVQAQEARRVAARDEATAQKRYVISQTRSILEQGVAALEASNAKDLANAEYAESVQRVCITVCEKMLPSVLRADEIGGSLAFWQAAERLACELNRHIGTTLKAGNFMNTVVVGYKKWHDRRVEECGQASEYARVKETEKALMEELKNLKNEREELGFFKREEKAAIDSKIEGVQQSLAEVTEAKQRIEDIVLNEG